MSDQAKTKSRAATTKPVKGQDPKGKQFSLEVFAYSGPPQSITFRAEGREDLTVRCHPGKPAKVPGDHPVTAGMIARELLTKPAPEADGETK